MPARRPPRAVPAQREVAAGSRRNQMSELFVPDTGAGEAKGTPASKAQDAAAHAPAQPAREEGKAQRAAATARRTHDAAEMSWGQHHSAQSRPGAPVCSTAAEDRRPAAQALSSNGTGRGNGSGRAAPRNAFAPAGAERQTSWANGVRKGGVRPSRMPRSQKTDIDSTLEPVSSMGGRQLLQSKV